MGVLMMLVMHMGVVMVDHLVAVLVFVPLSKV